MRILKELRKQRCITQEKLAKDLALSRSAISMYEIDASEPDFETTCKIADYFGVTVDLLLGRVLKPSEKSPDEETTDKTMLKLKELRGTKSQLQVANDIGIDREAYASYENGRRQANYEILVKLANYYNVSIDYLLNRTDKPDKVLVTQIGRGTGITTSEITINDCNKFKALTETCVIIKKQGKEIKKIEIALNQVDLAISLIEALQKENKNTDI